MKDKKRISESFTSFITFFIKASLKKKTLSCPTIFFLNTQASVGMEGEV